MWSSNFKDLHRCQKSPLFHFPEHFNSLWSFKLKTLKITLLWPKKVRFSWFRDKSICLTKLIYISFNNKTIIIITKTRNHQDLFNESSSCSPQSSWRRNFAKLPHFLQGIFLNVSNSNHSVDLWYLNFPASIGMIIWTVFAVCLCSWSDLNSKADPFQRKLEALHDKEGYVEQ